MHFCFSIRQVGSTFNWSGVQILCCVLIFLSFFSRHSDQSFTHHGQASLGLVRVVQSSHRARRPSGSHQQEAVARNHQGSQPTLIYHISSIHPKNTVSTRNYRKVNIFVEIYFFSVKTQRQGPYLILNIGYGTSLNSLWIHEKLFLPSTLIFLVLNYIVVRETKLVHYLSETL